MSKKVYLKFVNCEVALLKGAEPEECVGRLIFIGLELLSEDVETEYLFKCERCKMVTCYTKEELEKTGVSGEM